MHSLPICDHARVGHAGAAIDTIPTHFRRLYGKRRIAVCISHHHIPTPLGKLLPGHDLLVHLLLTGAICATIRRNQLRDGADLLARDCYIVVIILYTY